VGLELFLSVVVLLLVAFLTGVVRRQALSRGVLDVPNERSSHGKATPRGGGAAIVLVVSAAILLASRGSLDQRLALALLAGGIPVALVGFMDDRQSVPAHFRIIVHLAAAVWAVACLGGLPPLLIGTHLTHLGWAGDFLAVLGIVWTLNLFNFMDGIDGIAASEAAFVAVAGSVLCLPKGGSPGVVSVGFLLGAGCAGFLLWNWPPARIFMGDVGSGYLGYAIAVCALAAARDNSAAVWVWLILGGAFFVDATVTLVRRLSRGERVYEAHRSHAYQWLSRRWGSHRRVTLAVLLVDVLWLLPCAVFASLHPPLAAVTALIALAPLIALAIVAGAGRPEQPDRPIS